MATYRFQWLEHDDRVSRSEDHSCPDDLEALEAAKRFADDHAIEVWDDGRFVALVKPGDAPLGLRDARSL